MSYVGAPENIFHCGFGWLDHEPGLTWWASLDSEYRNALGVNMFDNDIPEIPIPKYKEGGWMHLAQIEGIIRAKDSIGLFIEWNNSKKGREYWLEAYTKLHIMENHLRVYMVMQRLKG